MLVQAKPGQWRILALIVQLSSDAVQRSDRAAMDATRARERLEIHVAELGTVVATQRQEADNLSLEINSLRADLDAKTNALEAERKLRNLDLAHAAGRTRSLLTGRFSLLLSDARDALSFEPPHVEAAKQRLDALRATIDQEVANSDE
jgi:hypothetical protein